MKKQIVVCDRCGKGLPNEAGRGSVVISIPKARACAEDDSSYTEEVDLCAPCCAAELQELLPRQAVPANKTWLDQVRKWSDKGVRV